MNRKPSSVPLQKVGATLDEHPNLNPAKEMTLKTKHQKLNLER
jgi:hypothetical protein